MNIKLGNVIKNKLYQLNVNELFIFDPNNLIFQLPIFIRV